MNKFMLVELLESQMIQIVQHLIMQYTDLTAKDYAQVASNMSFKFCLNLETSKMSDVVQVAIIQDSQRFIEAGRQAACIELIKKVSLIVHLCRGKGGLMSIAIKYFVPGE